MVTLTATPTPQPPAPPPPAPAPPVAPSAPPPDAPAVAVVEGVAGESKAQDSQGPTAADPMPAESPPCDSLVTDPTPAQAAQNPHAPNITAKQEKKSNAKVSVCLAPPFLI